MRAVVIRSFGGPEVLELRDVPAPEPSVGQVRIKVHFAAINRADLIQRAGYYPAPPGVPSDIPGLEYVGIIDAVGKGVTRFSGGERVFGIVGGGAYAEHVVVHEREVALVPASLTDEGAGAVPEAFITAYDALVCRGRLQPGERVLVHAAGSGVGTAAIQIARALGCFVIGTSRTQDKLDRCRSFGMDDGIVVTNGSFSDAVRQCTSGKGVDVVIDLVGGSYVPETISSAASRARIVLVGLTAGAKTNLDLGMVLGKRLEIIGTVLRARPLEEKIEAAKILAGPISAWLERGTVKPVVDRVFPMEQAADAHRFVGSNESFGKVLLDLRS